MHDGCDTKALGQAPGYIASANVDRQVAAARKGVEAHITEGFGKPMTGVITHQQYRQLRQRIQCAVGPGLVGGQQRVHDAWVGLSSHSKGLRSA
jgi:hypothetical protein